MTRAQSQSHRDQGITTWMGGAVAGGVIAAAGIAFGLAGAHTLPIIATGLAVLYGSLLGLQDATTQDRRARKTERARIRS